MQARFLLLLKMRVQSGIKIVRLTDNKLQMPIIDNNDREIWREMNVQL